MKLKKIIFISLCIVFSFAILTSCTEKATAFNDQTALPEKGEEIAIMKTNQGDIHIRLFKKEAPKAVENFVTHAKNGYFDGLIFHRVIKDFMIQGGDPLGTGAGGESIWGSAFADEFSPNRLNISGSLAMANSDVNTNSSQFFINNAPASNFAGRNEYIASFEQAKADAKVAYEQNKDLYDFKNFDEYFKAAYFEKNSAPDVSKISALIWDLYEKNGGNLHLDGAWRTTGGHTVFGQVFEGMDIVNKISAIETVSDKPVKDIVIKSIEITTY